MVAHDFDFRRMEIRMAEGGTSRTELNFRNLQEKNDHTSTETITRVLSEHEQ